MNVDESKAARKFSLLRLHVLVMAALRLLCGVGVMETIGMFIRMPGAAYVPSPSVLLIIGILPKLTPS
jgi:hypothetical protein